MTETLTQPEVSSVLMEDFEESIKSDVICECVHNVSGVETPCLNKAVWRVSVKCEVECCDHAAHSFLLCDDCKITWFANAPQELYAHKL